eukprot:6134561-Prymnesium_polylepis.1
MRVGRWGEELVFEHLKQTVAPGRRVTWHNEQLESGRPYDLSVSATGGAEGEATTYIEVKTSTALDKPFFEVSMGELEFAQRCGAAYHLYRVAGAGTTAVTLACLPDPLRCVSSGAGSIALVLGGGSTGVMP